MVDNVQAKFRKGREKFNDLKEDFVQSAKEKGEGFV
jgi:Asp-tRNA(Asn)/Glu-tRNA(Gln) amidotransferase C subunit